MATKTRQTSSIPLLHPLQVKDPDTNAAFERLRQEVQLALQSLGERVDKASGLRGTPELFANLEARGFNVAGLGKATKDDHAQTHGQGLSRTADGKAFDVRGIQLVNVPRANAQGQGVPFEQLGDLERRTRLEAAAALIAFLTQTHTWTALQTFSAGIAFGNETLSVYDEGTFIMTGTGFTANPTVDASYIQLGKQVLLHVPLVSATSNANTFTLTGLPVALQPTKLSLHVQRCRDNGVDVVGLLRLNVASSTIDLFASVGAATWTTSGVKRLYDCWIPYALL